MVHDHLYFHTALEIGDFEEVVDELGLKYKGEMQNGTQITVTPAQFEYLKLVKWYDEQVQMI